MRGIILSLVGIFFTSVLSAQTIIKRQKNDKQYHSKSIKKANTKNNNLIKVQEELTSTVVSDEIKQNQVISNQNIKSGKVKVISPTTVVSNRNRKKELKPSKLKYQRKKIKIKGVKDE